MHEHFDERFDNFGRMAEQYFLAKPTDTLTVEVDGNFIVDIENHQFRVVSNFQSYEDKGTRKNMIFTIPMNTNIVTSSNQKMHLCPNSTDVELAVGSKITLVNRPKLQLVESNYMHSTLENDIEVTFLGYITDSVIN